MINNSRHIVIDAIDGVYLCEVCGARTKIKLPKPLKEIIAEAKRFTAAHSNCTPKIQRFKKRIDERTESACQ